jgi:hypothetical protein
MCSDQGEFVLTVARSRVEGVRNAYDAILLLPPKALVDNSRSRWQRDAVVGDDKFLLLFREHHVACKCRMPSIKPKPKGQSGVSP